MTDKPMAKQEDYWESIEEDQQTVSEQIEVDADQWDILAVDLADRDNDGVIYALVIRRRVADDGNLILSERYYRYDPSDRSGTWMDNGIERRINGSLGTALKVLYAAVSNGDLDPEEPMLLDSRDTDGLDYNPDDLTTPVGDLVDQPDEQPGEEIEADPDPDPDREGWVSCRRCGEEIRTDQAVQFGEGDLGNFYVHEGGCDE